MVDLEDAEDVAREWSRGSKEFKDLTFDDDWEGIKDQGFDLALLIRFAKSEEWGDKQCYDGWAGHVVLNKSLQQARLTTDFGDTDAADLLRLYIPPHLFDSHHPKVLKALYCFQLASGIYKHATSKSIKRDIKDGFRTCLNGVLKTHKQTWSALADKFIDGEGSLDRHEKHSLIALGGLPKSDKDGVYYQPAQLSSDRSYMSNLRTYIGQLHGKSAINNVYEVFQAEVEQTEPALEDIWNDAETCEFLFPFTNGVMDLKTSVFRPARADEFILHDYTCGRAYKPSDLAVFKKVLDAIHDGYCTNDQFMGNLFATACALRGRNVVVSSGLKV